MSKEAQARIKINTQRPTDLNVYPVFGMSDFEAVPLCGAPASPDT